MSSNRPISEYEPVTRVSRAGARRRDEEEEQEATWTVTRPTTASPADEGADDAVHHSDAVSASSSSGNSDETAQTVSTRGATRGRSLLKRGHAVSYAGLFLFTTFLYFRPYELIPALSPLSSGAYYIALFTLAVFIPSQFALEGNLSARPREVTLVLLLTLCALLSLPFAINPGEGWEAFVEYLKVISMFVVMVNVVRTERRLKMLLLLVLAASLMVSVAAINDYRAGNLTVSGTRVGGIVGGMFGNPNDLALHLSMMIPIAFGLMLSTRGILKKLVYVGGALLMGAALVVTFSRGGFLGMAAASLVLAWKLGRRNRIAVVAGTLVVIALFLVLAPGEYAGRLATIVGQTDTTGSSGARQALLIRSIETTIKNPLLGVGMGNFHTVSLHEQVSHNAYTQVGAEMGVAAMLIYTLFVLSPLRRLRRIERETVADHKGSRDYYLSVCFQASVVGYMVSSFFGSVAYLWYIYYLVGYAFCFSRLYEARAVAAGKRTNADDGEREARAQKKERLRRLHALSEAGEVT
ncbi:MAG TPA: O-antigen ligase family protein [Pyrinomonadaceae bacterium]|nr:O-antigen ligase family protein [Pyrinomonadaceae bacterium]